jgi:hypothetical protein
MNPTFGPATLEIYKTLGIDLGGAPPRNVMQASVYLALFVYGRQMEAARVFEKNGDTEREEIRRLIELRTTLSNLAGRLKEDRSDINSLGMSEADKYAQLLSVNSIMVDMNLAGPSAQPRLFPADRNGKALLGGALPAGLTLTSPLTANQVKEALVQGAWDQKFFNRPYDTSKSSYNPYPDDTVGQHMAPTSTELAYHLGNGILHQFERNPIDGLILGPLLWSNPAMVSSILFQPILDASSFEATYPGDLDRIRKGFASIYTQMNQQIEERRAQPGWETQASWAERIVSGFWRDRIAKTFNESVYPDYVKEVYNNLPQNVSGGIHGGTNGTELRVAADALSSEINLRSAKAAQTNEKTSVAFSQANSSLELGLQMMRKVGGDFSSVIGKF